MAQYCNVCSKDLATDPTAEPPLCGFHARAERVQDLPEATMRVTDMELDPNNSSVAKFHIAIDTPDGRIFAKEIVSPVKLNYHGWLFAEWRAVFDALEEGHELILKEGWRPMSSDVRHHLSIQKYRSYHANGYTRRAKTFDYVYAPDSEEYEILVLYSGRESDAARYPQEPFKVPPAASPEPGDHKPLFSKLRKYLGKRNDS